MRRRKLSYCPSRAVKREVTSRQFSRYTVSPSRDRGLAAWSQYRPPAAGTSSQPRSPSPSWAIRAAPSAGMVPAELRACPSPADRRKATADPPAVIPISEATVDRSDREAAETASSWRDRA